MLSIRRILLAIIFLVALLLLSIIWHDVPLGIQIIFIIFFSIIYYLTVYLIKPSGSKQILHLLFFGFTYILVMEVLADILSISIRPFSTRLPGLFSMMIWWTVTCGVIWIITKGKLYNNEASSNKQQ